MSVRLIFKALKIRKTPVWITFFSVLIGAAVITALSSVYFDISAKMSRELRAYGANFFIGPQASTGHRTIDSQTVAEALGMVPADKLVGASPTVYGVVRLDLGQAVLAGVDFAGLRKLSPYWQVEGRWIAVDFDENSCMIGKTLAGKMELKAGDSVNVIRNETGFQKTLAIKGVVETGGPEEEQVFVTLALAQRILGMEGEVNHVMLSVVTEGLADGASQKCRGGTAVDALAERMRNRFPAIDAKPIRKISYSDGKVLDKIKGLMALVALIILAVTTLCVMTTLIAVVSERTREIGLMKAIGADNRHIVGQFLAETLLVGAAGVAAGLGLGFLLAQLLGAAIFGSAISFRPVVLPVTAVPSIIAALLAAAIPVRMTVRVVPAQVLRGE
ncbi:MAG: ABC transporter permease [Elusimicrobia bacterium]|nr:ABC transporter permease [Elusimicrobiota bacterium]